jgi:hypothetical protein
VANEEGFPAAMAGIEPPANKEFTKAGIMHQKLWTGCMHADVAVE